MGHGPIQDIQTDNTSQFVLALINTHMWIIELINDSKLS